MNNAIVWILLAAGAVSGCGGPPPQSAAVTSTDRALVRGGSRFRTRRNMLGVFNPSTAQWCLRMQKPGTDSGQSGGPSPACAATDISFGYGYQNDVPLVGDWDHDGVDTIGVYHSPLFLLRNSNSAGNADIQISFGDASIGDRPIVGDWDGDGVDTVGIYRSSTGSFILSNSTTGYPLSAQFGFADRGDLPVVGDWNGDGVDTVGVYRPSTGVFYLTNSSTGASVDLTIRYGDLGDVPVTGDWDGDGRTTLGVLRGAAWYLRNSLDCCAGDVYVNFGAAGDIPVTGNWAPASRPVYSTAPSSFFPLGIWYQLGSTFPKWKSRNINTAVWVPGEEGGHDEAAMNAWTTAANAQGLKMIRNPRAKPESDNSETNLLAWLLTDEPDGAGDAGISAIKFAASSIRMNMNVNPQRPIVVDLIGKNIIDPFETFVDPTHPPGCGGPGDLPIESLTCYPGYISAESWIMHDFYPVAWRTSVNGPSYHIDLGGIDVVAKTIDKVTRWSSKPQFVFVEASPQNYDEFAQAPSVGEFRAEIWLAIIHGARGLTYYTHSHCVRKDGTCSSLPGCRLPDGSCPDDNPDGMPSDLVAEMTTQNARITSLAGVLQTEINPPTLGFTVRPSSANLSIEAGWRHVANNSYFVVLNKSATALLQVPMTVVAPDLRSTVKVVGEGRSLTVHPGGGFEDTFLPYEVHIYSTN